MIAHKKMISVILLMFGAVCVCTIFGSYYLDLSALQQDILYEYKGLYEAQLSMSKMIFVLTSSFLGMISFIVVLFTIGHYIQEHQSAMGVLKALGYSNIEIAKPFMRTGAYVFLGAFLGYISGIGIAPLAYQSLNQNSGWSMELTLHPIVPMVLLIGMPLFFAVGSLLFAIRKLRKPALDMIKMKQKMRVKQRKQKQDKLSSFLSTLRKHQQVSHKVLTFFVGFAAFGFSAQFQLSFTAIDFSMSSIVPAICIPMGIMLGTVTLLLAGESIITSNKQHIAMMKAFGYSDKECSYALLDGYRLPVYIGFVIGTAYQYGLMIVVISMFAGAYDIEVSFNVAGFIVTLLIFVIAYEFIMYLYKRKLAAISLKQVMCEV